MTPKQNTGASEQGRRICCPSGVTQAAGKAIATAREKASEKKHVFGPAQLAIRVSRARQRKEERFGRQAPFREKIYALGASGDQLTPRAHDAAGLPDRQHPFHERCGGGPRESAMLMTWRRAKAAPTPLTAAAHSVR